MRKGRRKWLRKGIGLLLCFVLLLYCLVMIGFTDNDIGTTYGNDYVDMAKIGDSIKRTRITIDEVDGKSDLYRHILHKLSNKRHTHGGIEKEYILVSNIVGKGVYNIGGKSGGNNDNPESDVNVDDTVNGSELELVTLAAHCTESNLHYVHDLSLFWTGPISIAVFTYGESVMNTVRYLLHLHHCDIKIRHQATFHLVIPLEHYSEQLVVQDRESLHTDCSEPIQSSMTAMNYNNTAVPYPSNVLRNFAMTNVRTSYVLNVDVDLLPSENLYNHLTDFLQTLDNVEDQTRNRQAFVLPVFETNVTLTRPLSKHGLLAMRKKKQMRPFYWSVFKKCHWNTDYKKWYLLPRKDYVNAAYELIWKSPWEPFYVSRKGDLPVYNEAFKQYGLNRLSQVCEMHMAGYTFFVLDNGFLVHRGFKEKNTFHKQRGNEHRKNAQIYKRFISDLVGRYGNTTRSC